MSCEKVIHEETLCDVYRDFHGSGFPREENYNREGVISNAINKLFETWIVL